MNSDKLISAMGEVQALFPKEALAGRRLEPVTAENISELVARSLVTFSPVFLPIFVTPGGDLYAIHLYPGVPWQDGLWVQLCHDEAEPKASASRLKYVAVGMLSDAANPDLAWSGFEVFTSRFPGMVMPDLAPFLDPRPDEFAIRAKFDPFNIALRLPEVTRDLPDDEDILPVVEALARETPDNALVLAALAVVRAKVPGADATGPALEVLHREVPTGFGVPPRWLMAQSGPAVLEAVRPIALRAIEKSSPLALLKKASFKKKKTADVLKEVAAGFRALGDEMTALNQLRNGAAVAGIYGDGLTAEWCIALAEQAERIEPGGLSAELARFASEVIHLGP